MKINKYVYGGETLYDLYRETEHQGVPFVQEITQISSQELAELRDELNKLAESQPELKIEL